jgi:hypothetical protein
VRVFGRPAHEFSLACAEVLALGGSPGKSAVIRFLAREPGETRDAFVQRWNAAQSEAAQSAVDRGKVVRYVHNAVVRDGPPGYAFDGISETWFATVEDAVRALADPELAPLVRAPAEVTMLTEVIFRVPRE